MTDAANKNDIQTRFEDLVDVMAALRSEGGCPWDRKQTLATIKDYFTEEVYEALEAIENNDSEAMKEELGDVLFEVCFLARIAEEEGRFDIHDSIAHIVEKLIRRHPHVFGNEKVTEAEEVPGRWAKLKAEEKAGKKDRDSILQGVPGRLPPLLQALRVSERAVAVGFEWDDVWGVLDKLDEEVAELKDAIRNGESKERLEDELGDMLFTMVNVGRKLSIAPHDSLMRTLSKFRRRFGRVEQLVRAHDLELGAVEIEQLERFWQQAKQEEKAGQ